MSMATLRTGGLQVLLETWTFLAEDSTECDHSLAVTFESRTVSSGVPGSEDSGMGLKAARERTRLSLLPGTHLV